MYIVMSVIVSIMQIRVIEIKLLAVLCRWMPGRLLFLWQWTLLRLLLIFVWKLYAIFIIKRLQIMLYYGIWCLVLLHLLGRIALEDEFTAVVWVRVWLVAIVSMRAVLLRRTVVKIWISGHLETLNHILGIGRLLVGGQLVMLYQCCWGDHLLLIPILCHLIC